MKSTLLSYFSVGMYAMFHAMLSKAALLLYRMFAIVALYGILVGVLGYTMLLGVYALSTSWVAPVNLAPSDPRSLDAAERLITTQNSLEALSLELKRQQALVGEMRQHRDALRALRPELDAAIARERIHNHHAGKELVELNRQKRNDIAQTSEVVRQVSEVEGGIERDLDANLITKGEAAIQRAQLNQIRSSATDGQISEVLLRDSVLQKNTTGTQVLDILDKRAELQSQVAGLDVNIAIGEHQIAMLSEQVSRLSKAIAMAAETPYFLAVSGEKTMHFAFVPYENRASALVGSPVYDCTLNFLLCRRAGTVKRVFESEEKTQNPIFHTDMRGFLVQLELGDEESAKSKTLFLNHGPLFL